MKENKKSYHKGTHNQFTNSESFIISPILYGRLILPVTFLLGFLWLIIFQFSTSFAIPVIALIAYLTFSIWKQLEPTNLIQINTESKSFVLVPRNLLKKLLFKSKTIIFSDLKAFRMNETSEITLDGRRYIVFGVLAGGAKIPFYHSESEAEANKKAAFLNSVIRSQTLTV